MMPMHLAAPPIPGATEGLDPLVIGIVVFVLASYVGFEVITKVPTTLHTPLMSGSNAISGITIVGALLALHKFTNGAVSTVLAVAAVAAATINVVGGFLVTDRMLQMFRRPARKKDEEAGS